MKKIRVAFFAEVLVKEFDGATRTMFQIIERIDTVKYEFLFFCGVAPEGDFDHEVFHMPSLTIPFNKTYKMASMVGMGPKITEKLESFAPDVIHISTPSPLGYYALKHGKTHDIPVISIYHAHFMSHIKYYTNNTPVITQVLEHAVVAHAKSFYDRCDMVYLPTGELITELDGHGFKTNHMKVWRRGIDLDLFNPQKKDKEYISNLVRNDNPNILFVGRLVWEKNLECLINMYDLVRERGLKYNFIIAGDGVVRPQLEKRMPQAFFMKHTKQSVLARIYASADYFVFPSMTETYSNAIGEAMASGLPCLVADGRGVKGFVKQGINGFLCNADDPADFLKIMEILHNQPVLVKSITNQAYLDVMMLRWDQLVSQYFDDISLLSSSDVDVEAAS